MRKQSIYYAFLFAGLILLAVGLLLKFLNSTVEDVILSLTFIMIGLGAGLIGASLAKILVESMIKRDPVLAKQYEINEKDERNVRLREKAGYASWYMTLLMLALITFVFLVLDYKLPTYILSGALLIHCASFFGYVYVFNKKI